MDYTTIHELIKAVSESPLTTFEMENDGVKLVLKKEAPSFACASQVMPVETFAAVPVQPVEQVVSQAAQVQEVKEPVPQAEVTGQYITAPMVGTFYTSPSPDKPAFVKVGDRVKKGQVVCIVEAMKLMNEIESTVDGEIVEILVNNEDMVEYGQKLFVVR